MSLNKPRLPRCARIRAFTLLEVMMGAAMLALALMGAIQIVISGTEMLDMSRKQTVAEQLVHAEIDSIRLHDWTTVSNWVYIDPVTVSLSSLSSSNTLANGSFGYPELNTLKNVSGGFSITRTTAYVSGRSDMVSVTFSVTWKSVTNRSYTRTGTTYFGKNGLSNTYRSP